MMGAVGMICSFRDIYTRRRGNNVSIIHFPGQSREIYKDCIFSVLAEYLDRIDLLIGSFYN